MSLHSIEPPAWLHEPRKEFLSSEQCEQLNALFGSILPADHNRQIPGAVEAGASGFVSRLLAMGSETYWEIPAWRKLYTDALAALDQFSQSRYGKPLKELDASRITEILGGLEAGTLTGLPPSLEQKIVFNTLRRHCIQGCFADPRWGGNKDRVIWRAIGYLQPAEDLYHE